MRKRPNPKDKPRKTKYINDPKPDNIWKNGEPNRFDTYREKAHFYFDKIWMNKLLTRDEAYIWLAKKLDVTEENAHFGEMDNDMLKEAIYFCQQLLNDIRRLDMDWGDTPITPHYII